MTLYEELYYQLVNLPKFYRFEGFKTLKNYNFNSEENILTNSGRYIYFSPSLEHHNYYIAKRIKQFVEEEILKEKRCLTDVFTMLNPKKFEYIVRKVEEYPLKEKQTSIEITTSPLLRQLFLHNSIISFRKENHHAFIERVDLKKYNGGYGLRDEWLEVFNILTYFYGYQRINKSDIIDYLYALREMYINPICTFNPNKKFLENRKFSIKLNKKWIENFTKYEFMNNLYIIMEKGLYLPNSYLGIYGEKGIKKIMQAYSLERENILALLEENYKRRLKIK